jgi:hypothetical protein
MIQKLTIFLASLAAALVLAGGLALAGFGPAPSAADVGQQVEPVAAPATAAPEAPVQIDTVYLTPKEAPKEITVTEVKHVTSGGGEHEGSESGEHGGHDD